MLAAAFAATRLISICSLRAVFVNIIEFLRITDEGDGLGGEADIASRFKVDSKCQVIVHSKLGPLTRWIGRGVSNPDVKFICQENLGGQSQPESWFISPLHTCSSGQVPYRYPLFKTLVSSV